MPVVLVVGSLHHDIMVEADRFPVRDETAVGRRWYPKFGGKGGNQAVGARRAGAAVRFVGAVGDDGFGGFLRGHLAGQGVEDRFVATVVGAGSGISVAIVDAAGDYAATIVSGANLAIDAAVLDRAEVWQDVALLVLQNEVSEAVNQAAARAARSQGIRTLLNAAPARRLARETATLVDILVVNAVEAEMMGTGPVCCLPSAAAAATQLAAQFETVIVTAGAQGLAAWTADDTAFEVPAEKVVAVNAHGAGDAFIGALAAGLVRCLDLETACREAAHAAALHVSAAQG